MQMSPRLRRLRNDHKALEKLKSESTIFEFTCDQNSPPEQYNLTFLGRGFWQSDSGSIEIRDIHRVSIDLGAGYPRQMPELVWRTPIFHPNISSSGVVCLGGYGTFWVPSLSLDELCLMLWDMLRYQNYDVESPYNRDAATWARTQTQYRFPIDKRPIRDILAGSPAESVPVARPLHSSSYSNSSQSPAFLQEILDDVLFLDSEADVVDAEIVEPEDPDILFIE